MTWLGLPILTRHQPIALSRGAETERSVIKQVSAAVCEISQQCSVRRVWTRLRQDLVDGLRKDLDEVPSYNGSTYRDLTMHWDGTKWRQVTRCESRLPQPGLADVIDLSADAAWAVGSVNNYDTTYAEHWNDTNWTVP